MKDKTELGIRIRNARKAAHMNQTELAEKLQKTMRTIQKYESGEIEPSFAIINEIASILNVSAAELMGHEKQEIQLDTLSDVLYVINELNKKAGIRFNIEVNKPSEGGKWSCALKFDGNDKNAELNQDLCLFLERYADEIEETSDTPLAKAHFNHWFDTELAYYAGIMLKNKSDDIG